jgi:hypothetical protein
MKQSTAGNLQKAKPSKIFKNGFIRTDQEHQKQYTDNLLESSTKGHSFKHISDVSPIKNERNLAKKPKSSYFFTKKDQQIGVYEQFTRDTSKNGPFNSTARGIKYTELGQGIYKAEIGKVSKTEVHYFEDHKDGIKTSFPGSIGTKFSDHHLVSLNKFPKDYLKTKNSFDYPSIKVGRTKEQTIIGGFPERIFKKEKSTTDVGNKFKMDLAGNNKSNKSLPNSLAEAKQKWANNDF